MCDASGDGFLVERGCEKACAASGCAKCGAFCLTHAQFRELERDCPPEAAPYWDGDGWVCRERRREPLVAVRGQDRDAPAEWSCPAGHVPLCRQRDYVCERRMPRNNAKPPVRCNVRCPDLGEAGDRMARWCREARDGDWVCNRCTGMHGCFVHGVAGNAAVASKPSKRACADWQLGDFEVCWIRGDPCVPVPEDDGEGDEAPSLSHDPEPFCARQCPVDPPPGMCMGELAARCDACTGRWGCVKVA